MGVSGPVIFMSKGGNVHSRLRGNNLVNRYGFSEESCVIPNKSAYINDDTSLKVVKVLTLVIRKIKVCNVACVLPIYYLYIYISPYLSLQIIYRLYVISISGRHSLHIIASSLT